MGIKFNFVRAEYQIKILGSINWNTGYMEEDVEATVIKGKKLL